MKQRQTPTTRIPQERVQQRTVEFEHQPRISRISAEVDVLVSPGRLALREQVHKRRQHEQHKHNKLNKPQQQAEQTVQATERGKEKRERKVRKKEKRMIGKKEKGREAEEERDKEVKKNVTGWTVVTSNKRQKRRTK